MYDGVKIDCKLFDPQRWNTSLEVIGRHAEATGEVLPLSADAKYKACTFTKTPGKFRTKYTVQGSLHRYFENGGENDTDYTLEDVSHTINELKQKFAIDPTRSKLLNFEFGVNITLPGHLTAAEYQKYAVSAYTKAFEKLNPRRPMVGYIAEFSEYSIKVYDKGFQAANGCTNQLRFEIKVSRPRWLDQFGIKKEGRDLCLSDLLNHHNAEILGRILDQKIRSMVLTPRDINIKKLTPKERQTFYECRDARSWEEWNSKQRERKKEQLKRIFAKTGHTDPVDILAKLVNEKWGELTRFTSCHGEKYYVKKDTFSTIIVDGIRDLLRLIRKSREFVSSSDYSTPLLVKRRFIFPLPRGITIRLNPLKLPVIVVVTEVWHGCYIRPPPNKLEATVTPLTECTPLGVN